MYVMRGNDENSIKTVLIRKPEEQEGISNVGSGSEYSCRVIKINEEIYIIMPYRTI